MDTNTSNLASIPKGWIREDRVRKKGLSVGKIDVYIKSPGGREFRTQSSLLEYIQQKRLPYSLEDFGFASKKNKSSKVNISNLSDASSICSDESARTSSCSNWFSSAHVEQRRIVNG